MRFNHNKERKYKKRKYRESTRQYKRQWIARKKARAAETDLSELLEGQTYQTGVQWASYLPTLVPISSRQMKIPKLVIFDLKYM